LKGDKTMRVIVNFVGFQIGWFACVLGAAYGKPWVGPLVVLFLFLVHLALSGEKPREVALALAAAVIGFAFDSLLIAAGTFFPARDFFPAPLSSLWLVAMWVNFALLLNVSLRWLKGRYFLGAALGFIGGPMAYYAGARLGAIRMPDPLALKLLILAVAWGLAVPFLFWISGKKSR
jgi:hypothetical protein